MQTDNDCYELLVNDQSSTTDNSIYQPMICCSAHLQNDSFSCPQSNERAGNTIHNDVTAFNCDVKAVSTSASQLQPSANTVTNLFTNHQQDNDYLEIITSNSSDFNSDAANSTAARFNVEAQVYNQVMLSRSSYYC
jgi:hypothetical protein